MNKNSRRKLSYQKILNALPYYVLLVDSEHNIVFANEATAKTFHVDQSKLTGCYCPQVLHGKDHPIVECPLEDSLKTGTAIEKEVHDHEHQRWYLSAVYPTGMKTVKGREIYYHTIMDISAKKHAEQQIQEQEKVLISKNIALKELLGCIDSEKKELEKITVDTLQKLIVPKLKSLHNSGDKAVRKKINMLLDDIQGMFSNFKKRIFSRELGLSRREIEICNMIKDGLKNKEIAEELSLSPKTIETVRKNIRKKLNIKNRRLNLYNILNES